MSRHRRPLLPFALAVLATGLVAQGAADAADTSRTEAAVARLREAAGADARLSVHPATGAARFLSVPPGRAAGLAPLATGTPQEKAAAFFAAYGEAFGIRDAARELSFRKSTTDPTGMTHLDYDQVYSGVPVYAGVLKVHFDRSGALRTVNGVFIPGIELDARPGISRARAGEIALAAVAAQKQSATEPTVRESRLYVYRAGLAKGVEGPNHLAYEVEVGNLRDVREFVYVDAHKGKVVDQVTGIHEALARRVYDGGYGPGFIVWNEGDLFPTPDPDINRIITFTKDTYDMYFNTFGRDSYTGTGTLMETVNDDPTINCPNANWNGVSTNYCTNVTGDDTVAHEWTHAHTQFTHGLIYAWQPGALNESYSDIFGEIVDTVNGPNLPDAPRTAGLCSVYTRSSRLSVNAPAPIAGPYTSNFANWGPALTPAGTTGAVVLGVDATGAANDGCEPLTNAGAVAGNIALVDRGGCNFTVKGVNAQAAGAIAVIVANNTAAAPIVMGGVDNTITIPGVMITQADGVTFKANIATLNVTMRSGPLNTDDTYRWLSSEDDPAFGGAIRDMFNPTCYGDPAVVAPPNYTCATADGGGVHTNSGVPNHGFALMVDGGSFNNQTITGIGMTKAAHIYFRAMTTYQNPATDFADHADALEQSCSDLIGTPLNDLFGGAAATITAADCQQVAKVPLAVGLRTPPTFCNFQPLLDPAAPPACTTGTASTIFSADFETNPFPAWTVAHQGATVDFTPRDWVWRNTLPDRPGSAIFAPNDDIGTCAVGGDESGVLFLTSPAFTIPAGTVPRLSFEHWVATEAGFDGGNVKISVNGGTFNLINTADYTFNPYNGTLAPSDPLAPQAAFTGTDGGSVAGSWGRSYVNLVPYAAPGDSVRLRFEFGTDGCTGFIGWYVDDVRVYNCGTAVYAGDASVTEGNAGSTAVGVTVTVSPASSNPVTVDFATADGSATTANSDYVAATGTLTFAPGQTTRTVTLSVTGDTSVEPNEAFFVNLTNASVSIEDAQGSVSIVNDDGGAGITDTRAELSHGYRTVRALNNSTNSNLYWIQTQAASSYEVVVDAASGDIGNGTGPSLQRLASDGVTVLGSSAPVGTGPARSLRWATSTSGALNLVRVQSADCTTNCGADDTYRLRAYETTYSIPRFNNTGSQITILLLQNPTAAPINATVYYYNAGGTELFSQTFALAPKVLQVVNTAGITQVNGQSGTITVAHDGAYGTLAGKTVALEPSTGFSFDSPMLPRAR